VFGDEVVGGTGDVLRNWEAIKRAERAEAGETEAPRSALDGVPDALPALLRAERVQEKAAAVGFDFPTAEEAWEKVREEADEVRGADGLDALEGEVGDLLFAVVNYARLRGVVPETALRRTVAKFSRRFRAVEADLGDRLAEADLQEMDAAWDAAKAGERQAP
jgi:XTP/dITP diphosphohydrolase/tetrapyrrole methylase family protein/MazG family protein